MNEREDKDKVQPTNYFKNNSNQNHRAFLMNKWTKQT